MNMISKTMLLLVLFIAVCGYAKELKFDNDDESSELDFDNEGYEARDNFSRTERFGTGFCNMFFPGVGSIAVMDDWTGAVIMWALYGGGMVLMVSGFEEKCEDSENGIEKCSLESGARSFVGVAIVTSGMIYNIFRAATYYKPYYKRTAYSKYEGFNVTVMPNRHGNFMPAVIYNKTF